MIEPTWRVLVGDVRAKLAELPDESVQCVVTSPPYLGLRDYGVEKTVWGGADACSHEWGDSIGVNATNHTDKRRWNHTRNGRDEEQPTEKRVGWLRTVVDQGNVCQACGAWRGALGLEPTPELFIEHIAAVFREVRRVLKDDGVLWLNLGDSYATPPGGGGHQGKGGMRASRSFTATGSSAKGLGGCKPKDLVGIPWMVAFALRADGWYLRSDIIWSKPNPMPESVTDRPTKAHEYIFLLSKSARYFYDAGAIAEPVSGAMLAQVEQGYGGLGLKDYDGAGVQNPSSVKARIIANARRKNEQTGDRRKVGFNARWDERERHDRALQITRNARSVWTIPTQPYPEAHFATYPEELCERCIKAGSRLGDTVLDPFCGSGTTGQVAIQLGRSFIGIELNPAYANLSKDRIGGASPLFAAEARA